MRNFEKFVEEIVRQWRLEKKIILESAGLSGLTNRERGDLAEEYVWRRINSLSPNYEAHRTKGSQTPADIISVGRRNGYWHIMLKQVKSSDYKETIYRLNEVEIKAFNEFAKFVKRQIDNSEYLTIYQDKPIIISTGYVGVQRFEFKNKTRHRLIDSNIYKVYKKNAENLNMQSVKKAVENTHKL